MPRKQIIVKRRTIPARRRRLPPRLAFVKQNNLRKRNQIRTTKIGRRIQRNKASVKMTAQQRRQQIMPYIHCRINPWSAVTGGTMIPDGSDVRRIVVDHRFISQFSFGSSGIFQVNLIPSFPTCLIAGVPASDNTSMINGRVFSNGSLGSTSTPSFASAGIFPEWQAIPITFNNAAGQYDTYPPYLYATRARVVTMAMRIIYTGSTLANSGWIIVNRDPIHFVPLNDNATTFTLPAAFTGDSTQTYSSNQVELIGTDYNPTTSTVASTAFNDRLEYGAYIVAHHGSNNYDWVPVRNNVTYLTANTSSLKGLITVNDGIPAFNFGRYNMVGFCDDGWQATTCNISGGTVAQTFNVEVIVCVEYEPASNSQMFQMARNAPDAPHQIQAANTAMKNAPTASKTTGALTSVINTAQTIASGVKIIAPLMV
jgi:hypothetical protein